MTVTTKWKLGLKKRACGKNLRTILNRDDYYSQDGTILNDNNKFKLLEQVPVQMTFKRENKAEKLMMSYIISKFPLDQGPGI